MIRLTTPLIPFVKRPSDASDRPGHQFQRYFDALATQLVGHQAIGITSCQAGEGVSTVARNLAITFAQSRQQSTLLIDAAGDAGELREVFVQFEEPAQTDSPRERVCRVGDNLSVLTVQDPSTPLDSAEFRQLVDELKQDFELIVVDLPHADQLSGCFEMAAALDGVALVVQPGTVTAEDANRASSRLQQSGANLLGIVINKEK